MSEQPRFKCTVCGRIGTVGRCCGLETREPLNDAAWAEMAEARQNHFMRDLRKLLKIYGAEITADDHWRGYPESGQDIRITVEFDDPLYTELEFGQFIDKDTDTATHQ